MRFEIKGSVRHVDLILIGVFFFPWVITMTAILPRLGVDKEIVSRVAFFSYLPVIIIVIAIFSNMKTVVEYDGFTVRYKTPFKQAVVDLSRIQYVRCGYEFEGVTFWGPRHYYYVRFDYFYTPQGLHNPDIIRQCTDRIPIFTFAAGEHNPELLSAMYEDIIRRYPEKGLMNQMPV